MRRKIWYLGIKFVVGGEMEQNRFSSVSLTRSEKVNHNTAIYAQEESCDQNYSQKKKVVWIFFFVFFLTVFFCHLMKHYFLLINLIKIYQLQSLDRIKLDGRELGGYVFFISKRIKTKVPKKKKKVLKCLFIFFFFWKEFGKKVSRNKK